MKLIAVVDAFQPFTVDESFTSLSFAHSSDRSFCPLPTHSYR